MRSVVEAMVTSAPSSASVRPAAKPMPVGLPGPVTSATLPSRRKRSMAATLPAAALRDGDARENRDRGDHERQRELLAEQPGRQDQAGDGLQELDRRDALDAAVGERPVPADVADDRGQDR